MNDTEKKDIIVRFIDEGEKDKALSYLKSWADETSFQYVIFNILEPMLVELGTLWMQGKMSLAHGYLSGKVAEEFYILATSDTKFKEYISHKKGVVILGNIEDDFHPLGRRLVKAYSKTEGWDIVDLGNDVPASVFVEEAIKKNADIIAVSAMMYTTAKNISHIRDILDKQNLSDRIKLAVGGAVFKLRPELVKEVGGDGTADIAINAPELFENLLKMKNHQ